MRRKERRRNEEVRRFQASSSQMIQESNAFVFDPMNQVSATGSERGNLWRLPLITIWDKPFRESSNFSKSRKLRTNLDRNALPKSIMQSEWERISFRYQLTHSFVASIQWKPFTLIVLENSFLSEFRSFFYLPTPTPPSPPSHFVPPITSFTALSSSAVPRFFDSFPAFSLPLYPTKHSQYFCFRWNENFSRARGERERERIELKRENGVGGKREMYKRITYTLINQFSSFETLLPSL